MEAARSSSRPRKEALGLHDPLESFQTLSERGMKEKTIETICTERAGCIPPRPRVPYPFRLNRFFLNVHLLRRLRQDTLRICLLDRN